MDGVEIATPTTTPERIMFVIEADRKMRFKFFLCHMSCLRPSER